MNDLRAELGTEMSEAQKYIKQEDLDKCYEKNYENLNGRMTFGKPQYRPSYFYTCVLKTSAEHLFQNKDYKYIAYEGNIQLDPKEAAKLAPDLPNTNLRAKFICVFRAKAGVVEFGNSLMPGKILRTHLCFDFEDADHSLQYRR